MTGMPPAVLLRRLPELLTGLAPAATLADVAVSELTLDSRQVRPGTLFLACQGTKQHGLDFLPQALANGAGAVLWEPTPGVAAPATAIPAVPIEDLSRRAGEIAARFFGRPAQGLHAIGVTGTDGKTSTAWLLAQALEALGEPCLYVGTLGTGRIGDVKPGDHTTPDPVSLQRRLYQARADGMRAVAMEVSSHALDQARVAAVEFHTAVLTNVGRDHLDYHGTIEEYAAAKQRLFEEFPLRAAVLNEDDFHGREWSAQLRATGRIGQVLRYGLDAGAELAARNVTLAPTGIGFDVQAPQGAGRIDSRLLGRFNVYNLLAALGALLARDVPLDRACAALAQAATVPGRIEGFRGPAAKPLVVVDYAHTPQALAQILHAIRAHCRGKMWCVFGCGGDRDRGKRPLMGAAAARAADHLIVTDDNPRSEDPRIIVGEIMTGLTAAGGTARIVHDRAEAIRTAVGEAGPDDVVVVAGKGHEDYQIYGTQRRSFSDRAFVAELTGAARGPG
jgi:UDP-N-acetylmuramoyl-L-alanyl-D-glutamate--2,6-diaminopimelate ligase